MAELAKWFLLALFSFKLYAYVPVVMPNGKTLEYKMDGDVKVFHLIAEPIVQEFAPGLVVNCWGYNGQTPGPLIEAMEGDRVRILVTNKLPEYTTVHWHGILLPNGMDGVNGLTQPSIRPGETFVYEFTLRQNGTYMYHPHADEIVQIGMGLVGMFIIHPKEGEEEVADRDYAIMLGEWMILQGASTPDPMNLDFNYFTFNGKVWPRTEPLVAKLGERVRIRIANLSMNAHPIHLHGYEFAVTRRGAWRIPDSAQYTENTTDVPVGATRDIEFIADNPGDWAFHCHKSHHVMNGMAHGVANMIDAKISQKTVEKIKKFLPEYMPMGTTGMGEMFEMHHGKHGTHKMMPGPPNFLPYGSPGPFDVIDMGGMFTILKVREELVNGKAPGWYQHPPGTVAHLVNEGSRTSSHRH